MVSQFDVTPEQKSIIEEKAKRRLALREEFLKQASNPFKHASGEGGAVVSFLSLFISITCRICDITLSIHI